MRKMLYAVMLWLLAGSMLNETAHMPVMHATARDWNHDSYWFPNWGASGVHKGIDIFAHQGTPVLASSSGLIVFTGTLARGGQAVAILTPKGRVYYYAHLSQIRCQRMTLVKHGQVIGAVGNSGNAQHKPPHLHFSIVRLLPNPAEITLETQGWLRMFYLNPTPLLMHRMG